MVTVDLVGSGKLCIPPLRVGGNDISSLSTLYAWMGHAVQACQRATPGVIFGEASRRDIQVGYLKQGSPLECSSPFVGHFKDVDNFHVDGKVSTVDLDAAVKIEQYQYVNLVNNRCYSYIDALSNGLRVHDSTLGYYNGKRYHSLIAYVVYPYNLGPGTLGFVWVTCRWTGGLVWTDDDPMYVYQLLPNVRKMYLCCTDPDTNRWRGTVFSSQSPIVGRSVTFSEYSSLVTEALDREARDVWIRIHNTSYNPTDIGSGASWVNIHGTIPNDVEAYDASPLRFFPESDRNPDWNEMAKDAYQDLGFFQGNGIAFVHDIATMSSAVRSTLATARSLGARKLAAVAQLFLSFHYGWKLLAMDASDLADSLELNDSWKRCQSHLSWSLNHCEYDARYQVYYSPFDQLVGDLRRFSSMMDLDLRLGIGWDMIPFSFVVDWFVQIGDSLAAIDNYYNLRQKHTVLAVGRSIKCTKSISPKDIAWDYPYGDLQAVYFHRKYQHRPIDPSILPSVTRQPSLQHFVEGTALVVALR